MATAASVAGMPAPTLVEALPPLRAGDHLDQETYHERYEAMPHVRAELIGGIVFMASPAQSEHSGPHGQIAGWLHNYAIATPGVELHVEPTIILGEDSEPEPDACLLISPGRGGQVRKNDAGYFVNGPELVVEVAFSSEAIDLHRKKRDYEKGGVREYVVVVIRKSRVLWSASREGKFVEVQPGADGIYRSEVFPGLWLDPVALLRMDGFTVNQVLQQGLATPEHAAFVKKLAKTST